ncbi:Uncharacterised protein [Providencia rettgeri]|uniref:Uncharacterized protein n=1 Tax=Providencia rettgeri TaxID=587 RepID=A0A9N8D276_PRORE|nr:Uncharacterised protein [Providencia rettgeri]CAB5667185.1 Uncharacterised protein [Providencia rettgeri]CAC9233455.1 Uncharacterised protein [Providencia rettgeri]CAC9257228.1 Uncharacterised protein [Providencia rettgeri]
MTNNPWLIISGILLLAVGTYLMRASGALLRGRVVLSENSKVLFQQQPLLFYFQLRQRLRYFQVMKFRIGLKL